MCLGPTPIRPRRGVSHSLAPGREERKDWWAGAAEAADVPGRLQAAPAPTASPSAWVARLTLRLARSGWGEVLRDLAFSASAPHPIRSHAPAQHPPPTPNTNRRILDT